MVRSIVTLATAGLAAVGLAACGGGSKGSGGDDGKAGSTVPYLVSGSGKTATRALGAILRAKQMPKGWTVSGAPPATECVKSKPLAAAASPRYRGPGLSLAQTLEVFPNSFAAANTQAAYFRAAGCIGKEILKQFESRGLSDGDVGAPQEVQNVDLRQQLQAFAISGKVDGKPFKTAILLSTARVGRTLMALTWTQTERQTTNTFSTLVDRAIKNVPDAIT